MKTLLKIMLFTAAMSFAIPAFSQNKKDTVKINPDPQIKKAAKTVGNKTAETAVKGAAKITDKTYANKVGPNGQTIYINKNSNYYYVNKKGAKVFVAKSQLKDKPVNP